MFGWRIIHKRELNLYAAQIGDLRDEIKRLHGEIELERDRAEKAVNMLLAKTQGMAMKLDKPMSIEQEEEMKSKVFDIFDEGNQLTEEEVIEELSK